MFAAITVTKVMAAVVKMEMKKLTLSNIKFTLCFPEAMLTNPETRTINPIQSPE